MKIAFRKAAVPAMLAFAMLAGSAWAQQASTPASTPSSSASPAKTHAQKRADAVEQRIDDLHTQLKITDAQSKQWDAFAQTMRDNARKASEAFHDRAQKLPSMNADEAMKSYAELAQMHADNMQKLASAWSGLYAVLSTEQKQTADAMYQNQAAKPHHMPMSKKAGAPAAAGSAAAPAGN